jgi:YD repeat-containing protein
MKIGQMPYFFDSFHVILLKFNNKGILMTIKKLVTISWIFFIAFNARAQKIDWVKAPVNPIAHSYKLEHFNLPKGVFAYKEHTFNKDGTINTTLNFDRGVKYFYENGILKYTSGQEKFEFNAQGYISEYSRPGYANIWEYTYNNKGLITTRKNNGSITSYAYDSDDRIIKMTMKDDKGKETYSTDYSYSKEGGILEITLNEQRASGNTTRIKGYKDGFEVYSINNGNRFDVQPRKEADYFAFTEIEGKQLNIQVVNNQYVSTTMAATFSLAPKDIKVYINGKPAAFIPVNVIDKKQVVLWDFYQKKYVTNPDVTVDKGKKLNLVTYNNTNTAAYAQIEKSYFGLIHEGITYTQSIFASSINHCSINEGFHFFYIEGLNTSFSIKANAPGYYEATPVANNHHLLFVKNNSGLDFSVVYLGNSLKTEFLNIEQSAKNTTYASLYHGLLIKKEIKVVLPNFNEANTNEVYAAYELTDFESNPKLKKIPTAIELTKKVPVSNIVVSNEEFAPCVSGDCRDGYGVKKIENNVLRGLFLKGKFSLYGERFYGADVYKGEFLNGIRSGYGVYYWKELNQYYYGYWRNGKVHGFGFYVKDGKLIQAGEYEDGKQKFNYLVDRKQSDIAGCEGNCVDGFGKFTYSNGDTYEGFWTGGIKEKVGHYYFKNADSQYYGSYSNGFMEGAGMYTSSSLTYIGDFVGNQLTGKGIKFFGSGIIEAGRWENGKLIIKY